MKRRKFFTNMTGVGVIGAITPISLYEQLNRKQNRNFEMDKNWVAEWNMHLWSSDTKKYPIHPNAAYQPNLSALPTDPLPDYLKQMDKLGIDKAVVVQPEPYGDDHSLILDCLNRSNNRLKGTSLFYPKDEDAPKKLASLIKDHPEIVSTRFHAHRGKENYLDSFSDQGVRALWKQAVDLNLIIELHIGPNYAKQAAEAIKAFPGCKVLIDHFAEPQMGTIVEYSEILDLASLPNVYMKFSGISHFVEDEPYFLSAKSFTNRVIRAFGVDRILMGGVSTALIDLHMSDFSAEDRSKVKGNNLIQLLNWKS